MQSLRKWKRGDPITHQRLNEMGLRAALAGMHRGAGASMVHMSTTGVRTSSKIVVPPILFEIYQPLTYPANAAQAPYTEAKRLYLDSDEYGPLDDPILETIYCPLALRDSSGDYIGLPKLRTSMYVCAIRNRQSGRWEIVSPNPTTVPFELTENLAFGSNGTAKLLILAGDTYSVDNDVTFEVYDPFSKFNQNCKPTGQDGARGHAAWIADSGRFEIQEMQHQARWIKFAVNDAGGFDTSDASVAIDTVSYCDGYQPDTEPTTVYNVAAGTDYIFEGADDARGLARYCPGGDKYYIWQMECP